jgi:alkylation response protein AidB-like acyl-CoA dehydrogenase
MPRSDSEDQGGFGGGRVFFASVTEEISKACASTGLILVSHAIVAKAIELAAGEAVKKKWLPEMVKGQSLGAFAVHEPEKVATGNGERPITWSICRS